MNNKKAYKVSAPGSLMLFGEHAVLHGKLALVAAIDKYIIAELTPRRDDKIYLRNLGKNATLQITLSDLNDKLICSFPEWRFVLASIIQQKAKLLHGFDLVIKSDFSETLGFGSSAAVTVATLSVLESWLSKSPITEIELLKKARNVISRVQGIGSGADAAASIFGGVIAYKMRPLSVERIASQPPLVAVYSGYKTPTVEVVKKVAALTKRQRKIFSHIFAAMDECAHMAKKALEIRNWPKVGELMNIHQGLQDALGTSDETLARLVFELRQNPNIFGAKISGSGLGDSVIGIGSVRHDC